MDEPTRHAGRCVARLAALVLSLMVAACGSEGTTAAGTDGVVTAAVTGPADVSAVVIDFTSVSDIDVEGGDVFTSVTDGGIRAVIVLHEPGTVRVQLTPVSGGVTPTAVLVDVADAAYEPANPGAYDVVVGS
jgi:hypothetical protein